MRERCSASSFVADISLSYTSSKHIQNNNNNKKNISLKVHLKNKWFRRGNTKTKEIKYILIRCIGEAITAFHLQLISTATFRESNHCPLCGKTAIMKMSEQKLAPAKQKTQRGLQEQKNLWYGGLCCKVGCSPITLEQDKQLLE